MKTNFTKQSHLVLSNEDGKIMAIISVPAGSQDISLKISKAISEDYDCDAAEITEEKEIDEFGYEVSISVDIVWDGEPGGEETFTLTKTEVY